MSDYIGPKQQALVWSLRRGALLRQENGRWYTTDAAGLNRRYHNRERCMGLYLRGFLMATNSTPDRHWHYVLTDKGRNA
jgi:hypothetical protein